MKKSKALKESERYNLVMSVDAGSTHSGIVMTYKGKVIHAEEACPNDEVFERLYACKSFRIDMDIAFSKIVLIEDIKPYSLKLNQDTIDTCKYIGELRYCLKQAGIAYKEVSRSVIKEWVWLQYGYLVRPLAEKKVEYRSNMMDKKIAEAIQDEEDELPVNTYRTKDGTLKSPSFIWLGDREIAAAMRVQWNIVKPKVGKKQETGLTGHALQALALATYFLKTY